MFRPWGFQAGHQIEWSKLLLILRNHLIKSGVDTYDTEWMADSAESLFRRAYAIAWDKSSKDGNALDIGSISVFSY